MKVQKAEWSTRMADRLSREESASPVACSICQETMCSMAVAPVALEKFWLENSLAVTGAVVSKQ